MSNTNNTITVITELCQEDRKRLDDLLSTICWAVSELKSNGIPVCKELEAIAETPTAPQEEPKTEAVKDDHPVDEPIPFPEPVAETPIEEPKPTITHEMIQQKVKAFIANGTPEQNVGARNAVTSRARNISSLPADALEAVWAELVALGEV